MKSSSFLDPFISPVTGSFSLKSGKILLGNGRDVSRQSNAVQDLRIDLSDLQKKSQLNSKISFIVKYHTDKITFPNAISLQDVAQAGGVTAEAPMILHVHADGTMHASDIKINLPVVNGATPDDPSSRIHGQASFDEDL